MDQADNASKCGLELGVMVEWMCGGEFRRFEVLCVNFCVLQMKTEKLWDTILKCK